MLAPNTDESHERDQMNARPEPQNAALSPEDKAAIQDVLAFWFVENGRAQWFQKDDAFDEAIARRFGPLHERAAAGGCETWADERDARMALILVLDQFSRNLHRGSPKAFAQDAAALAVARKAIALGDHLAGPKDRCVFLFLPFEHSESLADQDLCLSLFETLGDADYIDYANRHRVIIERFGRFPHRNAILGRESTAEERAFLEQPNSSF